MHNHLSVLIMHLVLLARFRRFSVHVLRLFRNRVYDVSVTRYVVSDICNAQKYCNHNIGPSYLLLFPFSSDSDHRVCIGV